MTVSHFFSASAYKEMQPNTGAEAFCSCAPSLCNNLPLSVHSATSIASFKKIFQDTSLWLGLFPIDTSMLYGLLLLLTASWISLLNTKFTAAALSLASPGILVLQKFDWLIEDPIFSLQTKLSTRAKGISFYIVVLLCQKALSHFKLP